MARAKIPSPPAVLGFVRPRGAALHGAPSWRHVRVSELAARAGDVRRQVRATDNATTNAKERGMPRLAGQVAMVTGGALGIGGATARRFAEEGAKVLIVDINEAEATRNAARITDAGGTAAVAIADVGNHELVQASVERAVELWGG